MILNCEYRCIVSELDDWRVREGGVMGIKGLLDGIIVNKRIETLNVKYKINGEIQNNT